MVFDPSDKRHADPPNMWSDAIRASQQTSETKQQPPENVEGLAEQYAWIGLDPAEARKVPGA